MVARRHSPPLEPFRDPLQVIEAIIDKQGSVTDSRVSCLPMGVSEAAVAAIGRWKYKPAMPNGRPVAVYLTVTVTFTLQ
jgi:TonB family protein